jgi:hypothetical protein
MVVVSDGRWYVRPVFPHHRKIKSASSQTARMLRKPTRYIRGEEKKTAAVIARTSPLQNKTLSQNPPP